MSVNPNLETLMSLVEDLQDQMPEGKYLEAMNALRDLHRNAPAPVPRPEALPPWQPRPGYVKLSRDEMTRYRGMQNARHTWLYRRSDAQKLYQESKFIRDACDEKNITEREWVEMEYEDRIDIIHRALLKRWEARWNARSDYADRRCGTANPDAKECPFISRHAVGRWDAPSDPKGTWSCVCGSKNNLSKNWEKHAESKKHQEWHQAGRRVSTQKTNEMKKNTHYSALEDRMFGWRITSYVYHWNQQDSNEWTSPQTFAHNIPPANANWVKGQWAYFKMKPLPPPVIGCLHDPLSPEDQAKYGRAEYLAELPFLPTAIQNWRNNENIMELSNEGYAQFLAMTE
jgi:hypothetical protein